jgi:hypothetical protein
MNKQNSEWIEVKPLRLLMVRTAEELETLRCLINDGHRIEGVEGIAGGYSVSLSKLAEGEKEVWGESFGEYAERVFVGIEWKWRAMKKTAEDRVFEEAYRQHEERTHR